MDLELKMMRHPTRQQLVAFAETLVDRRAPVSAAIAAHVSGCQTCTQEVKQVRTSLEFTNAAPALEPSGNLTAQILLEAKRARKDQRAHRSAPGWLRSAKGLAWAASIASVAGFTFNAMLHVQDSGAINAAAAPAPAAPAPAAPTEYAEDAIERATAEIASFSLAVRFENSPQSLLELERLRAVSVIGADLAAAKAALQRNPGCERATDIVNATIQRGAETLRDLYVGQAF